MTFINALHIIGILVSSQTTGGFVAFPRGGSFGYLAAVAMPLDLPNRNVYMAFNFEANYGLPPNDSYYDWINRWNLASNNLGIEGNVTAINGRAQDDEEQMQSQSRGTRYTRESFYGSFVGFLQHFGMNATACLWRTVCEVASEHPDVGNGVLGNFLNVLFMPSTSAPEKPANSVIMEGSYDAEIHGLKHGDCTQYNYFCPEGLLDMISDLRLMNPLKPMYTGSEHF